jgi:uncharacterized membrane protein HdeD (DUF308 family)
MGSSPALSDVERRIEEQFGLNRGLLLGVGLACLALGGLSAALPMGLYGSMIRVIGFLAIGSGLIKASQLLLGRRSPDSLRRGWPVILGQVALDLALGALLIRDWRGSVVLVVSLLGLLFLAEGLLLLYAALRSPSKTSLVVLILSGVLTGGIGLALMLRLVSDPLRWAGVLVGLKLISFGGALVCIALRSPRSGESLLYESAVPLPIVGEAYAVYFGTAFHLGISIGNNEVVHYLNDNFVYRVTWEQFLDGRTPEHWTYPDLEPVLPEVVMATALGEVGKTYPYNLLTFNCENFAIFCKSGGRTNRSKYAQIASGAANLARHPVIGMVAEGNTRLVEWLAFHFGGPSGKQLSLFIRRVGAAMTNWLVSAGR